MKKEEYEESVKRIAEIKRQARVHQHMAFEKCVRCKNKKKQNTLRLNIYLTSS